MSSSEYYPDNSSIDIGSSLGTIFGTILNYQRDFDVHCQGSLEKAHIDRRAFLNERV